MTTRHLRRHATTIALCVLAVGLVVGVLLDRGSVTTDETEQGRGRLFVAWREAELSEVQVTAPGGSYRLVREQSDDPDEPGAWRLLQDGQPVEADQQEVGQLLASLELGRYERQVDAEGLSQTSLGLEDSAWRFEVQMGKLAYVLTIGAEAPSPVGGHYAAIEGAGQERRVVVIGAPLVEAVGVEATALRARELLPYSSSSIRRLVLADEAAVVQWTLEQVGGPEGLAGHRTQLRGDDRWVRADRRSVTGLLVSLAQLEALRFMPPASQIPGRDAAQLALDLTLVDSPETSARLELHGPCPDGPGRLVVRRAPSLVYACVAAGLTEQLGQIGDKLADRFVVGAAPDSIVELKLASDRQTVEVARKGSGWHMRAPRGGTADDEAVNGWLAGLLRVRGTILSAAEAADPEALGLTPPRATGRVVSLSDRGSDGRAERLERFEVGAVEDGALHVRRLDDDVVLQVPELSAQALLPQATAMRSTVLWQLRPRQIRSLELRAGERHQRVKRAEGGGWSLLEPKIPGVTADPTLLAQLAERLAKLRAVRWAADAPVAAHGLAEPSGIIEATIAADPRAPADAGPAASGRGMRIVLGAEAADGIFAQHDDDPGVFVLDRTVAHLAGQWLLDRTALMVQPSVVRRVVLTSENRSRSITVEHEGERWQVVAGEPATNATALLLRDSLRDLMAEGVVRIGPARSEEGFDVPVLTMQVERSDGPGDAAWTMALRVGRGDAWHNTSVFYVRRDGVDATYAVAQTRLQPLVQMLCAHGGCEG